MKTTITIYLLLLLLSCDNKTKTDDQEVNLTLDSRKKFLDDINGDWGIYGEVTGEILASCNACPRVVFRPDGNGTITYPSGTTEQIVWTRQKDKLTITNISANSLSAAAGSPQFEDGDYLTDLTKTKTGFKMILTKAGTSDYLILRR